MDYLLFWNKILAKRAVDLIKRSPAIFIGMIVIIFAYIIGRQNITIELNIKTTVILLFIFAVSSIITSLRNYNTIPVLIAHSKSNLQNKDIKIMFFIKQAVKNNVLLIIISFILFAGFIEINNYAIILIIIGSIISIVFSFLIMYLKNGYANKKIYIIADKKSKITPAIKRAYYDYFTPDFFVLTVFCYALFGTIIIEASLDMSFIREMQNPSIILTVITAILSVGIMGVIEIAPNLNWKFLSIIYPLNIFTHIKKTALFMIWIFGLLFVVFILMALHISIFFLLKYLYGIIVLLLFSVYNAFTRNNMIIKAIRSIFFSVLVIWVSTLDSAFLFLPIIPLLIIALLAKNDFREWYLQ